MQQGIDNIKTMKELEERKARQKEIFDATFEGIQSVFDKYYAAVNKDRNKFDYAKFATETGEAVNKELQRLEKAALTQLERKEFEEKQVQELKGLGWIQWNGLIAAKIGSDFAKGMGEGRLKEQQKSEEKAVKENIERLAKEQRESGVQSEDAELQRILELSKNIK